MSHPCPECESPTVAFTVPADLRDLAPGESTAARLCPRCLRTFPADETAADDDPSFDAVLDSFPSGEAGAALALALGRLDSLALERAAIVTLCEYAEEAGADVYLALDRLVASGRVQPHFDLDRRRDQLREFL